VHLQLTNPTDPSQMYVFPDTVSRAACLDASLDIKTTMSQLFRPGAELHVFTRGPGMLHLLSFQSNSGLTPNISTARPTEGDNVYLIAAGFTYERFALIWTGEGEAVYQVGNRLERSPVGTSWNAASTYVWGAGSRLMKGDVMVIADPLMKADMPSGGLIYAIAKTLLA
jgi:hypothetical protein